MRLASEITRSPASAPSVGMTRFFSCCQDRVLGFPTFRMND